MTGGEVLALAPNGNLVSPGLTGFLVTFAVAIAFVFLMRLFVKHFRLVNKNVEIAERKEALAAERAAAEAAGTAGDGDGGTAETGDGGTADAAVAAADQADATDAPTATRE